MKKIAFANNKGGVGKTTITFGIAMTLAQIDKKVLIFDTDPQGNITSSLITNDKVSGINKWFDRSSNNVDLINTIKETIHKNISIIPASADLTTKILKSLQLEIMPELIFKQNLEKVINDLINIYDYIIFDTPPTSTTLSHSILIACDEIITVIRPHMFSLTGLQMFKQNYNELIKTFNSNGLKLNNNMNWYLLNDVSKNKLHSTIIDETINQEIKNKLLKTIIYHSVTREKETMIQKITITNKNPFYLLITELIDKEIL